MNIHNKHNGGWCAVIRYGKISHKYINVMADFVHSAAIVPAEASRKFNSSA